MLDGAVLTRGVQTLEHQEHAVRVLGGEPVLVFGQKLRTLGEQGVALRPGYLAGVARIGVTTQPDSASRRHLQRFDEVRHEAETLVHPLTMPVTMPWSHPESWMRPVQ